MSRFVLALIAGLLSLSASGVSALVLIEPCAAYEQPGSDDGACPPTCVTCGCCAQAVEPAAFSVTTSPDTPVVVFNSAIPRIPQTRAREILHVPKPQLA